MVPDMGSHDNTKTSFPDSLPLTADEFDNPDILLLFPKNAKLPADWQLPWVQAGWSIVNCLSVEEIPESTSRQPGSPVLVAVPWPTAGSAPTDAPIHHRLKSAMSSPGLSELHPPAISDVRQGMMRRGDFLANLDVAMRSPDRERWTLLAIRVDQATGLAAELDATAKIDLEESICRRIAVELTGEHALATWLEFGFGALVKLDDSTQMKMLAERICLQVGAKPFSVAGELRQLTVSIGIALPPRGAEADRVGRWFAAAHAAQAIAVRHGGNCHDGVLTRDYEPIPAERVLIIREWVQEALSGGNVMLDFEPVLPFSLDAKALYSVHAKLRDFRAPLGGAYRREYLRIAREAGAIPMIDRLSLFGAMETLEQEVLHGRATSLLVPVDTSIFEGVAWRWLLAELHRRHDVAARLIIELDDFHTFAQPERQQQIQQLRELGVGLCLSNIINLQEEIPELHRFPVDLVRIQLAVLASAPPGSFNEIFGAWQESGRQLIVDGVEDQSGMARYSRLGIDYLCGKGVAAIGQRLDYEFG